MKPRRMMLALALVATLAAAFWPRPREAEVVGAVARVPKAPLAGHDARDPLPASRLGAMRADLFPAQSWQPPPPPQSKREVMPPADLTAPPLPFEYLGRWREDDKEVVFLAQGSRVLQARVGDVLAGWRLDRASDDAIAFTWIALNMQQTLRISP